MNVEIISDLVEIENYSYRQVLDKLFDYLSAEQRINFAYYLNRIYELDVEHLTMQEAIDECIVTPKDIIEEASQYFSNFVQKDFIRYFLETS